jgi:hypothetical protein
LISPHIGNLSAGNQFIVFDAPDAVGKFGKGRHGAFPVFSFLGNLLGPLCVFFLELEELELGFPKLTQFQILFQKAAAAHG